MSLSTPNVVNIRPQLFAVPYPRTSLRIENILCPVNFSNASFAAFEYSAYLARRMRSRLFVEHTIPDPSSVCFGRQDIGSETQSLESLKQQAGIQIRRMAAVARLQLREVRLVINAGDTHQRVLQSIAQNDIGLVVMSTPDHNQNPELNWISLTEKISCDSRCPVLIVPRQRKNFVNLDELGPARLSTIVLATDFSSHSDSATVEALKWAACWSAKIDVIHVVENGPRSSESENSYRSSCELSLEKQLARALDRAQKRFPALARKKITISRKVERGNSSKLVCEFAEEKNADLIIMGSRGWDTSGNSWGSTITGVVRVGRFPVLTVSRSTDDPRQPGQDKSCLRH